MTLAGTIASFATGIEVDDLPDSTVAAARVVLADTLACAVGGARQPAARALIEFAASQSSSTECTVVGGDIRSSAPYAALINATAARDLDANDLYATIPRRDTGHFSDAIPALLAMAESTGALGRDLILATVIAYEVQAALAESYLWMERGLHSVSQVAWAVPPALGKMLGLDEEQIASAIGLAGSTGGLILQSWLKPSTSIPMLKSASAGFAAMRGVEAALLSKSGFSAPDDALETLFDRLPSSVEQDRFERLQRRERFAVERSIIKRYPSQIYTQSAVELASELSKQISSTDEIAVATVYGHRNLTAGVQGSGPAYSPETREAADHSTPFVVAMALRDGALTPGTYAGEPWKQEAVIDLMRRVDLVIDPERDRRFDEAGELGCSLVVELTDGRRLEASNDQPLGHPDRPLSEDQLLEKLAWLADPVLGEGSGRRIWDAVQELDSSQSLEKLLATLRAEA